MIKIEKWKTSNPRIITIYLVKDTAYNAIINKFKEEYKKIR